MQQAGKNQDIRFSDKRVENVRNFGNKLWNAARFVIMNLEGYEPSSLAAGSSQSTLEDKWITSRLHRTIKTVNDALSNYDIDDAANTLYDFVWNEFCDWYIELAKPRLRAEGTEKTIAQANLYSVLYNTVGLLHPIMPFITEEIYQALPHIDSDSESIMLAAFPEADESMIDEEAEGEMATVMDAIRAARNLRADLGLPPSKRISLVAVAEGDAKSRVERNADSIKTLARLDALSFVDSIPEADKANYAAAHLPGLDLYAEVAGAIDVEAELARIDAELKSLDKDLAPHQAKLSSEQFTSKAPAAIVEKERRIVAELTEKKQKLIDRKQSIGR
jgi:valyl-tRNA synthetase